MPRTSPLLQTRTVNRTSLPMSFKAEEPPIQVSDDRTQLHDRSASPTDSDSASELSSSGSDLGRQNLKSQIFKRTPRFANPRGAQARSAGDDSAGEDDDDMPAFVSYEGASGETHTNMGDTLRSPEQSPRLFRATSTASEVQSHQSISSAASSASSAMPLSARRISANAERQTRMPHGEHKTEIAGNSPMGSSFSDLDGKIT